MVIQNGDYRWRTSFPLPLPKSIVSEVLGQMLHELQHHKRGLHCLLISRPCLVLGGGRQLEHLRQEHAGAGVFPLHREGHQEPTWANQERNQLANHRAGTAFFFPFPGLFAFDQPRRPGGRVGELPFWPICFFEF